MRTFRVGFGDTPMRWGWGSVQVVPNFRGFDGFGAGAL